MSNRVSRTDVVDEEFVDAIELASDGYTNPYRVVGLISTTASSRNVVISTPTYLDRLNNVDEPVQVGDIFEILSGVAAGTYIIEEIVDPLDTFRVVQTIADSIDGYGNLYHPAGATKIGVDPRNLTVSESNNLQQVLEDLDQAVADGYGTPAATMVGQVLFSINGITFQRALPITTTEGWVVNDLGYLIVRNDE